MARATWMQAELLNTFSPSGESPSTADESPSTISAVTVVPRSNPETAGRFRIWLYCPGKAQPILIHDRKTEGGFAEIKAVVSKDFCFFPRWATSFWKQCRCGGCGSEAAVNPSAFRAHAVGATIFDRQGSFTFATRHGSRLQRTDDVPKDR